MVTKSKNIKYSFGVRAAAFILAMLLFGASGYLTSSFFRSLFNYQTHEGKAFTETEIFRKILNGYETGILETAEIRGSTSLDEFKKTEAAKSIINNHNSIKAQISEAFKTLDNSGIEVFVTRSDKYRYRLDNGIAVYYFSFDGTPISRDEFESYEFIGNGAYAHAAQSGTAADSKAVGEALYMIWHYSTDVFSEMLNYGEISEEYYLKKIDENCEKSIEEAYSFSSSSCAYNYPLTAHIKNIRYAVYLTNGNVITNCGATRAEGFENAAKRLEKDAMFCEKTNKNNKNIGVTGAVFAVPSKLENNDLLFAYSTAFSAFETAPGSRALEKDCILSAICFIAACAICIYLLVSAGKTENGEIKLLFIDKVPLAVNIVFYVTLASLAGIFAGGLLYCEAEPASAVTVPLGIANMLAPHISLLFGASAALCIGLLALLVGSIARNIRAKTFFRHTLLRIVLKPLSLLLRRFKEVFEANYESRSEKTKTAIVAVSLSVFAVLDFILVFVSSVNEFVFALAILINFAALVLVLLTVFSFRRIDGATREIRNGNTKCEIPAKAMPPFMRKHAENVLGIGDGIQSAVESAVRDQKMKAELITNVSHDLKTPLTSIVNYVDLLKKCEIENEDAEKYINILDEKSLRMKKLIEDLVEASKASSGAVEIHPMQIDLCEFAAQSAGENEDGLREKGIETVLRIPDRPVTVCVDPQKTDRIFENLFSNIKKYALENTRAYIEVSENEKFGIIEFKNISKYELSVPARELTERFVRGDSSRNGDGSGLGLSIAENLCTLQGGSFSVATDGDLFKASVRLPKMLN